MEGKIFVRRVWGEKGQGFRAGETYFVSKSDGRAYTVIAFPEDLVPQHCVPMILSPAELFEEDECCEVKFVQADRIIGGPHGRNHINGDGA